MLDAALTLINRFSHAFDANKRKASIASEVPTQHHSLWKWLLERRFTLFVRNIGMSQGIQLDVFRSGNPETTFS